MTAHPGQFLAGKRIIVTGGSFAALSFVLALDQLWNPSLERPEVIVYKRDDRDLSIQKDPYTLNINGASHDDGLVAIQQLGLLDEVRKHATLNGGDIRVWADNWKWLSCRQSDRIWQSSRSYHAHCARRFEAHPHGKSGDDRDNFEWGLAATSAERLSTGKIQVTLQTVKQTNAISLSPQMAQTATCEHASNPTT
ncbi:hypothetical protein N7526_011405 [Penicillium atrosanguineum]|nr:hypothetical protein N7526_011405 [Penicillium atrosanguineum]